MTKKEREGRREKYKPIYDMFIALYPFTTENLDGEEFKPIPYCADYHCSNFGRIKSFKKGNVTIRKPQLNTKGYLYFSLWKDNREKKFSAHVLVATLFIPNPENKPEVNHEDGVKFNCHVSNLVWSTGAENKRHAFAMGLHKSGEDRSDAKLTAAQVLYIRQNPDGLNTVQLAAKFGVAQYTISEIQRGKRYKNVGGTIREKKFTHSIITDEQREEIRARYRAGSILQRELAEEFNCSHQTIWRIIHEED